MEAPTRRKLKILEPAILSLIVWGGYRQVVNSQHDLCAARAGTAAHLISQLDQAAESYQIDCGVYPPGNGTGTVELVEALSRSGPKKQKYFEFPADLLREGSVVNPVRYETGILHYLCPGIHRPSKFDLWAEDCRGNPTGINNW